MMIEENSTDVDTRDLIERLRDDATAIEMDDQRQEAAEEIARLRKIEAAVPESEVVRAATALLDWLNDNSPIDPDNNEHNERLVEVPMSLLKDIRDAKRREVVQGQSV